MSSLTRRDFLKNSAVVGGGFILVNGLLVPRESVGASPVLGVILTSLLQVITSYLYARNSYRLSSFNDQYRPYDNLENKGMEIRQNVLYSGYNQIPIDNFSNKSEGTLLSIQQGRAYMNNGHGDFRYDPAELKIAHKYHEQTGYELFPTQNKQTGYYEMPDVRQIGLVKERSTEDSQLSSLGTLGKDYVIQGTREFQNDKGSRNLMMKLNTKQEPRHLKTAMIEI